MVMQLYVIAGHFWYESLLIPSFRQLWCWISRPWGSLRLGVYYGIVWFAFIVTLSIYTAAGIKMFLHERGIQSITASDRLVLSAPSPRLSDEIQPSETPQLEDGQLPANGQVILENPSMSRDQQTSEPQSSFDPASIQGSRLMSGSRAPVANSSYDTSASTPEEGQISDHISASQNNSMSSNQEASQKFSNAASIEPPAQAHLPEQPGDESYSSLETLPELADLRRRQSLANIIDFERRLSASTEGQEKKARRLSLERHNAAKAYAKFASIYFISLIITWVPATSNRIYIFIHPLTPNFGLLLAAAIGLPLQGFWNAIIFFTTSWSAVKAVSKILMSPKDWTLRTTFRRPLVFFQFLKSLRGQKKIQIQLPRK
ncbi:conserved hypothetical protein [Coccidioides posadasii str. Silveira]|uniref:Uncharacterized protein n=1 Tax=Coccidioides posadasii (strain RMSCC 757 / Silveira) TaxID=443226 RepID=E9DAV4_COCPS|nr:conserved hypothetical protein [Coccidioides posadasii str. Silveira]